MPPSGLSRNMQRRKRMNPNHMGWLGGGRGGAVTYTFLEKLSKVCDRLQDVAISDTRLGYSRVNSNGEGRIYSHWIGHHYSNGDGNHYSNSDGIHYSNGDAFYF